ncbi:D-glycerate dehydrogenase [Fodinicurvata sp. EGI_FJ10296]|uniref:2-hydroxyacid dehydrogenase n=1 Tax=Fodinicurvata sp. EGI_FJ10296 TaxID=3231908 RepID=UPI0034517377
MTTRPRVHTTRKLPAVVETRMMELFTTRLTSRDEPVDRRGLLEMATGADILVPTLTDRLDAEFFESAPRTLRLIANFGNGVDHIDLAAAARKGIMVTNTPGVLTDDTADMTMALILATVRRLSEGERVMRSGAWAGWSPTGMLGRRLSGLRLGIIGLGRIGRAVAARARAFGMTVHYHNRARVDEQTERDLEATYWADLDQMLAHMDVVSVNCPQTPATYHLLSAQRLALMKTDAVLVNTARGEIVDEAALTEMLLAGRLAGAGLDVFAAEPHLDDRLRGLESVVLLPHMGSATIESRIEMGQRVILNIRSFWDGHSPPDRVIGQAL